MILSLKCKAIIDFVKKKCTKKSADSVYQDVGYYDGVFCR